MTAGKFHRWTPHQAHKERVGTWSGPAERSFGQLRARKWFLRRPVAAPTVLVHRGYLDGTVPGFIMIARAADPDLWGPPRSVFLVPNRSDDYLMIMFCCMIISVYVL